MKKLFAMIFAVMMICIIPMEVKAAEPKIEVTSVSADRSQIIYLTVSLRDCAKANTLGISMEYDSTALKKIASNCSWKQKGVIENFDIAKNNGVWTTNRAKNLNGEICVLAFRVKSTAQAGDTVVKCTVTVKNDSKIVGTYTASGTVHVKGEPLDEDVKDEVTQNPDNPDETVPDNPETTPDEVVPDDSETTPDEVVPDDSETTSNGVDKENNSSNDKNNIGQSNMQNPNQSNNSHDNHGSVDLHDAYEDLGDGYADEGMSSHEGSHIEDYDNDDEPSVHVHEDGTVHVGEHTYEEEETNNKVGFYLGACALLISGGIIALVIKMINGKKK